jgi:hypothetical protein
VFTTESTPRSYIAEASSQLSTKHNASGYNWAKLYGNLPLQVGGVSNLRQYIVVMNPAGLGLENVCAGEAQEESSGRTPNINKPAKQITDGFWQQMGLILINLNIPS